MFADAGWSRNGPGADAGPIAEREEAAAQTSADDGGETGADTCAQVTGSDHEAVDYDSGSGDDASSKARKEIAQEEHEFERPIGNESHHYRNAGRDEESVS